MSCINNTTKTKQKQYHHLTENDRAKIQYLVEQKDEKGKRLFNNTYIANYIGVDKSTISRELRNRKSYRLMIRSGKSIPKPYNAVDAQNNYIFKRGLSKGEYKLRQYPKMAQFIKNKIKIDKWSPDVIVGYMKTHGYFDRDGFCSITTPTIYSAIRLGIIDVKLSETRRMKEYSNYEYKTESTIATSKIPYSIENRPDEIDSRLVFGHFELDTVVGTNIGKHECLMTLTERKTRFEIIFKLNCKTSEEVVNKFN